MAVLQAVIPAGVTGPIPAGVGSQPPQQIQQAPQQGEDGPWRDYQGASLYQGFTQSLIKDNEQTTPAPTSAPAVAQPTDGPWNDYKNQSFYQSISPDLLKNQTAGSATTKPVSPITGEPTPGSFIDFANQKFEQNIPYAIGKLGADFTVGKAGAIVGGIAASTNKAYNTITDALGSAIGIDPKIIQSSVSPEDMQIASKEIAQKIGNFLLPQTERSQQVENIVGKVLSPVTDATQKIGSLVTEYSGQPVLGQMITDLMNYKVVPEIAQTAIPAVTKVGVGIGKAVGMTATDLVSEVKGVRTVADQTPVDWNRVPRDASGIPILREPILDQTGKPVLDTKGEPTFKNLYEAPIYNPATDSMQYVKIGNVSKYTNKPIVQTFGAEGTTKGGRDIIPQSISPIQAMKVGTGLALTATGNPYLMLVAGALNYPTLSHLIENVAERAHWQQIKQGKFSLKRSPGGEPESP